VRVALAVFLSLTLSFFLFFLLQVERAEQREQEVDKRFKMIHQDRLVLEKERTALLKIKKLLMQKQNELQSHNETLVVRVCVFLFISIFVFLPCNSQWTGVCVVSNIFVNVFILLRTIKSILLCPHVTLTMSNCICLSPTHRPVNTDHFKKNRRINVIWCMRC
jgi:hypothetical protein